jgi:hypothetical protein
MNEKTTEKEDSEDTMSSGDGQATLRKASEVASVVGDGEVSETGPSIRDSVNLRPAALKETIFESVEPDYRYV